MNKPNIYHVIKDPIHGTMQFTSLEDKWVKPLIDSANFQRLRHIKQLGFGDYIFPGAVHTRFNHCLGCAYVASQIAHKIGLSDEDRQLVMVACLLHDIGHGPFSHAFEDIYARKIIRHEAWTPYFLGSYRDETFISQYNRINPQHPLSAEKFMLIEQMIMHTLPRKSILGDIVSSQLDADRLDYLLRDSYFCGVRYGEYDFRWMLHCLTIVNHDGNERLAITHKGIGVVEHYLMARRLMLNNIYRSHKKLAIEAFLQKYLALCAERFAEDQALRKRCGESRLVKFLTAVHAFNQKTNDPNVPEDVIGTIKAQFLSENFQYYQSLCDYDIFSGIELLAALNDKSDIAELAKRLHQRHMPKVVRIDYGRYEEVATVVADFKARHRHEYADWQMMLIQLPHQSYSGEEDPILVSESYRDIQSIERYSLILSGMSDKFEHVAFLAIDKNIANDASVLQLIRHLG